MSNTTGPNSPENELQFDHVEYTAPASAATCGVCKQPMQAYYEVNGRSICERCHEHLQQSLNGGPSFGRFVRATIYGSVAGLLGAAIYYGVREATNIEFGIIAIVVGLIIGQAVKKGSNARGGWFYQGLAIFLTYSAIVLTYIPPVMKAIADDAGKKAAAAKNKDAAKQENNKADAKAAPTAKSAAKAPQAAKVAAADPTANPRPKVRPTALQILLALLFLIGFSYALPILIGFQSPMSLLIIGIGLYEAWVINRRMRLSINGPFQIGPSGVGKVLDVEPSR